MPECGSAIEQTIRISGRYIKATRWEPAEGPDIERADEIPDQCECCGHVFTPEELKKLDQEADDAMRRYDWYSDWEDMTTNWGEE